MTEHELQEVISINNSKSDIIYQDLLRSLKKRNFDKFNELLLSTNFLIGFDKNYFYQDPDNGTLLDIACRSKGNCRFVRLLIRHGADINLINTKSGKAPIHEAVANNDIETVKVLIKFPSRITSKNAADININDMYGQTPMMIAAYFARLNILSVLLKDENVSLRSVAGKTMLHSLIDGVRELGNNQKSSRNKLNKYYECLDFILNRISADESELMKLPDLIRYATDLCDENISEKLIEAAKAARIEYENDEKITDAPMLNRKSARNTNDDPEIRDKLLSFLKEQNIIEFENVFNTNHQLINVDYFYTDPENGTLLDIACRSNGNGQFVGILIDYGAEINTINRVHGKTPIHEAVEFSDIDTLNNLINSERCDLNMNDIFGRTPIMKAAYHARKEILSILLQNENVSLAPLAKKTIIHSIVDGWIEFVGKMRASDTENYCQCLELVIQTVAHDSNKEVLFHINLVKLHNDVDYYNFTNAAEFNKFLKTLFDKYYIKRFSAKDEEADKDEEEGSDEVLSCLLKSAPLETFEGYLTKDVSAINQFYTKKKGTLLDIACRSTGYSEYVGILLKCGADVNLRNEITGKSAIHEAVQKSDKETLHVLLQHEDCDIDLLDKYSYSAMDYAALSNNSHYIDILLDYGAKKHEIFSNRFLRGEKLLRSQRQSAQKTPIMKAIIYGNCKTFKRLVQERNVEIPPADRGEVLHLIIDGAYQYQRKSTESFFDESVQESLVGEFYSTKKDPVFLPFCFSSPVGVPPIDFSLYEDEEQNYTELLKYILRMNILKGFINSPHKRSGHTPMQIAVYLQEQTCIMALLQAGVSPCIPHPQSNVVSLQYIRPETLKMYLDSCITTKNRQPDDENCLISFDYTMFKCKPSNVHNGETNQNSEMEILMIMDKEHKLRDLLTHPVISSFLQLKLTIVQKYFWWNFALYFLYWSQLNLYTLTNISNHSSSNSAGETVRKNDTTQSDGNTWTNAYDTTGIIWRGTIILLSLLLIVRELCQAYITPKIYFKSYENWIELWLFTSTCFLMSFTKLNQSLAAVVILASWFEFMLLIGRYPSFSTPIEMFKTVLQTFLKYLLVYSIMLLGFVFAFHIEFKSENSSQYNKPESFDNLLLALFKSIVMFSGEFNTSDIPFQKSHGSYALFILFVLLISTVLLNLLNGLAVGDTQKIINDAEILGQVTRVKLLDYIGKLTRRDRFHIMDSLNRLVGFVRRYRRDVGQDLDKYIKSNNILNFYSKTGVLDTFPRSGVHFKLDRKIIEKAVEALNRSKSRNHQ